MAEAKTVALNSHSTMQQNSFWWVEAWHTCISLGTCICIMCDAIQFLIHELKDDFQNYTHECACTVKQATQSICETLLQYKLQNTKQSFSKITGEYSFPTLQL
jgi:hypothetical protein